MILSPTTIDAALVWIEDELDAGPSSLARMERRARRVGFELRELIEPVLIASWTTRRDPGVQVGIYVREDGELFAALRMDRNLHAAAPQCDCEDCARFWHDAGNPLPLRDPGEHLCLV
jgi:hypothetical protein